MDEVINFIRHDRVKSASASTPVQFGETAARPVDGLASRLLTGLTPDVSVAGPSRQMSDVEVIKMLGLK